MKTVEEIVHGRPVRSLVRRGTTIVEVLQQSLVDHADSPLLIDLALAEEFSYRQFAELVEGAAARLQPDQRVGVLARNGLEIAVATWACARAGAVFVGLPVDLPAVRLQEFVELTGVSIVYAQSDLIDVLPGSTDIADLMVTAPWDFDRPLPDEDETYCLIATSGTTGRPKAVRITGRMATHAAEYYCSALALTPDDRTAIHLSFAWVSGHISQLCPTMYSGGSAVTMDAFTPTRLIKVVQRYGISWIDVVPSIWEGLLRSDDFNEGLSSLRAAIFGGAPAPAGTLERVRQRVPRMKLYDVYAQSETCAPVTMLFDEDAGAHAGTVGRATPHTELRIDPRGGVGELLVRSGSVTPGYLEPDVAPIDGDGWFRTGDLASIDDEGFVTTHGRAVDLIIRGGRNIFPAEVEKALLATGLVSDVAVVGVPSPVSGQRVAAAVVPVGDFDAPTARAAVAAAIGTHAAPKLWREVDELPRNRNGKVDRVAVLRSFFDSGAAGPSPGA